MARFQVVAVYPSGTRYPVRDAHDAFTPAEAHRSRCEQTADPRDEWTYEIDVSADGGRHWRPITGEDLGYSVEELAGMQWDCKI